MIHESQELFIAVENPIILDQNSYWMLYSTVNHNTIIFYVRVMLLGVTVLAGTNIFGG